MTDYNAIFSGVEATLITSTANSLPEQKVRENLNQFKDVEKKVFSDDDYYWMLVSVVFYSGFRAATVTSKIETIRKYFNDYQVVAIYGDDKVDEILSDEKMIRNKRKIQSCVINAGVFQEIVNEFGSFKRYIDSFESTKSFENLILLKEELEYRFSGLGRITTYHFLTDIGMPVLKPDRVICRIFKRLGLIDSEKQLLKTIIQGRKFSQATGQPIRYIDIVFVVYGQVKSEDFGIERGICLKNNPSCNICGVTEFCNYYQQVYIPNR